MPTLGYASVTEEPVAVNRSEYARGHRVLGTGLIVALMAGCGDSEPEASAEPWQEAFPAESFGWLLSVWGPSPSRLYAVGGQPGNGRMMAWDGAEWSEVQLPAGVGLINWVYGFGADEAYAVGEAGLILRFDGTTWRTETTTTTEDLWGVWGARRSELWAVGGRGRADGQATLLKRGSGAWEVQPLPPISRPGVNALFKVWGTSASNVYVVGQRGAVLRFDGSTWTFVGVGTSRDLIALWGTGPDNVVIVGGRGNGEAVVWDGSIWSRYQLAPLPGLNGVWTDEAGSAWVVGEVGTIARLDTATGEYQIESLSLSSTQERADFHAVFGNDAGQIFAVGGNFSQPGGPFRGLAFGREPVSE